MPWICRAFDSLQNSGGNSGAVLPGYIAGICSIADARFQYGGKTTKRE